MHSLNLFVVAAQHVLTQAMVTRGRVDSDSMGAGCDWIRHHSHRGQVPPSQTAKQTKRRITFYSPPNHIIVICPEQWPGSWQESKLLTIAPTKRAGIGLILGWTFFYLGQNNLKKKIILGWSTWDQFYQLYLILCDFCLILIEPTLKENNYWATLCRVKTSNASRQVPGFTLPFNIVGWIVWAVLLRADMPVKEEAEAVERLIVEEVDWTQLFLGSLVAMGQVWMFIESTDYRYCFII